MIKDDLAHHLSTTFGLSMNQAGKVVQALLDQLIAGLIADSNIELRRFGIFRITRQKPRIITLPSGQKITRPAQKVITFTPSPFIKKKLNPPPLRLRPPAPGKRPPSTHEPIAQSKVSRGTRKKPA